MKLQALINSLEWILNQSADGIQKDFYPPEHDFRKQTTSLSANHFPVLVSAALLASGIKETDLLPLDREQANIIHFLAPVFKSVQEDKLNLEAIHHKSNADIEKRIHKWVTNTQVSEDFMAIALSDPAAWGASHGMRVHLMKNRDAYTIEIEDSVNDGDHKNTEQSINFRLLENYLTTKIKDKNPVAKITARESPVLIRMLICVMTIRRSGSWSLHWQNLANLPFLKFLKQNQNNS